MSLTADDRLDILDLFARYNLALDDRDLDAFLACWVERGARLEGPDGTFTDLKAIRANQEVQFSRPLRQGKHRFSPTIHIRPGDKPGTAVVHSDFIMLEVDDLPQVVITGRSDDVAVKT